MPGNAQKKFSSTVWEHQATKTSARKGMDDEPFKSDHLRKGSVMATTVCKKQPLMRAHSVMDRDYAMHKKVREFSRPRGVLPI